METKLNKSKKFSDKWLSCSLVAEEGVFLVGKNVYKDNISFGWASMFNNIIYIYFMTI